MRGGVHKLASVSSGQLDHICLLTHFQSIFALHLFSLKHNLFQIFELLKLALCYEKSLSTKLGSNQKLWLLRILVQLEGEPLVYLKES